MKRLLFEGVQLSIDGEALIVRSERQMKILSSAPVNGGLFLSDTIVNKHVEEGPPVDLEEDFRRFAGSRGLRGAVGLMTCADLSKAAVSRGSDEGEGLEVAVIVTAGAPNAASVCDGPSGRRPGTINTIIIVNREMTDGCMANVIMSAAEAKCLALSSLDLRSASTHDPATGTTSDAIAVATLCSPGRGACRYAGSATALGYLVGKNVESATRQALMAHDALEPHRPLEERLRERGITADSLVSTAMEMYVAHPGVPADGAEELFRKLLREALGDPNVASLIMAAIRLDEDGSRGLIPCMGREEYLKDPVGLVADEVLGISIATYIAGYNGLFEYYRFDRKKPGILGSLPAFLDDALGALLGGVSSRMYDEMMRGQRR